MIRLLKPPKPTGWQTANVISIREETPRVKTIRFAVERWPGHLAGQHADVRLTAEDGYRAERSYSIASPAESPGPELTIERLEDGEVSPFLTGELQPGDTIELRGPIGGHFVWSASEARRPLILVGGGSGIVPLMCMLRHRRLSSAHAQVPAALLYSCRSRTDVIYHKELDELARIDAEFTLHITLTRERLQGWSGSLGRIDLSKVHAITKRFDGLADCFVCGRDGFVEAASMLLMQAGHSAEAIRTERFGAGSAIVTSKEAF